jgi:hypothetical protein
MYNALGSSEAARYLLLSVNSKGYPGMFFLASCGWARAASKVFTTRNEALAYAEELREKGHRKVRIEEMQGNRWEAGLARDSEGIPMAAHRR